MKLLANKPVIFVVFKDEIVKHEVIMETEKSYFTKRVFESGDYYEHSFPKYYDFVFTDYNEALEQFNKNKKDENKV